jgi:hypothetical protein
MTLVHALLQPNSSLYRMNNEDEYTKRHFVTENQDRGPKTCSVILNNNVIKHVVQASTDIANGKETNYRIYEQHADKRHKTYLSIENDGCKVSKTRTPKEENVTEELQTKSYGCKAQNKQRYKTNMIHLIEIVYLINMLQLNKLIFLLKKKVYLYLISQILQYNYIMEIYDKTTITSCKTGVEMDDKISKYYKNFSTNRRYFTIWKILSLIRNDTHASKEIIWRWSKNDDVYEERTETIKIKQVGAKIIRYLVNGKLKYDIIGMFGTKVKLNAEITAEYVEVLDLIKLYKEHRPLSIENNKFNERILNIDKYIWKKRDEIVVKDCIKEVHTDNCTILCKESNDVLSKEIDGYLLRDIGLGSKGERDQR